MSAWSGCRTVGNQTRRVGENSSNGGFTRMANWSDGSEEFLVFVTDCAFSQKGMTYTGPKDTSHWGRKCQAWSSQYKARTFGAHCFLKSNPTRALVAFQSSTCTISIHARESSTKKVGFFNVPTSTQLFDFATHQLKT